MARRPPLGQHFLRDQRLIQRIVTEADVQPGQRVLEIGPGPATLTEPLAQAVGPEGQVIAVEADAALAGPLEGRWDNVQIVHGDALQVDLNALGPFQRIVSNLPYQISGPITMRLLEQQPELGWEQAVLMYQKEFAERLLAGPGSKTYGRLSVHAARACTIERIKEVPPGAFDPPPKVRSLIVRLRPHASPPFTVDDHLWRLVVDGAFGQRRKQLRNTLPTALLGTGKSGGVVAVLESMGFDKARPESLPPEAFAAIVAALERA